MCHVWEVLCLQLRVAELLVGGQSDLGFLVFGRPYCYFPRGLSSSANLLADINKDWGVPNITFIISFPLHHNHRTLDDVSKASLKSEINRFD